MSRRRWCLGKAVTRDLPLHSKLAPSLAVLTGVVFQFFDRLILVAWGCVAPIPVSIILMAHAKRAFSAQRNTG